MRIRGWSIKFEQKFKSAARRKYHQSFRERLYRSCYAKIVGVFHAQRWRLKFTPINYLCPVGLRIRPTVHPMPDIVSSRPISSVHPTTRPIVFRSSVQSVLVSLSSFTL